MPGAILFYHLGLEITTWHSELIGAGKASLLVLGSNKALSGC